MQGGIWPDELLEEKREGIIHRWFELVICSYPADGSRFLRDEKDRFHNPVGHTIREEIEVLFRLLLEGGDEEILVSSLDNIVKIRLVQDFSPSQAVGCIFLIKQAVREELHDHLKGESLYEELLDFESRVDRLALTAFDRYMANKVRIYEIRTREIIRRSEKLLERVERLYGEHSPEENGLERFPEN